MPKKIAVKPLFSGSPHLKQWQQCYEEWLLSAREHSGSQATVNSYRCETRLFFTDPRKAPERYTREDVAAFIRNPVRRQDEMCAPSCYTRNRRLATLKSFYDFAACYQVPFHQSSRPLLSGPNPCSGLHSVKTGHKPKGLTEDELRRLFVAIPRESVKDKRDYALLSFYFWTARRRSEILRLTWGNIVEVVLIENGVPRVGHMYRFSTKGHSRDVFTAELRPEAWEALLDYLKASGRYERMQPESPLFVATNRRAEKPLNPTVVNRVLWHYAELAELQTGRKISPHWLRHTRAQLQWIDDPSEKALTKIQRLLGHENISTTMIYLAGAEEKPDDGAARLASKLGKL